MVAFSLTSGVGLALSIIVLGLLFVGWLVALFLLVTDSIAFLAKIVWFVVLTVLAPLAIPIYLIVRWRRAGQQPAARTA